MLIQIRIEMGNVKRPKANRVSQHFENKKNAMKRWRGFAKKEELKLISHDKDGKIQNLNKRFMFHPTSKSIIFLMIVAGFSYKPATVLFVH